MKRLKYKRRKRDEEILDTVSFGDKSFSHEKPLRFGQSVVCIFFSRTLFLEEEAVILRL